VEWGGVKKTALSGGVNLFAVWAAAGAGAAFAAFAAGAAVASATHHVVVHLLLLSLFDFQ